MLHTCTNLWPINDMPHLPTRGGGCGGESEVSLLMAFDHLDILMGGAFDFLHYTNVCGPTKEQNWFAAHPLLT